MRTRTGDTALKEAEMQTQQQVLHIVHIQVNDLDLFTNKDLLDTVITKKTVQPFSASSHIDYRHMRTNTSS